MFLTISTFELIVKHCNNYFSRSKLSRIKIPTYPEGSNYIPIIFSDTRYKIVVTVLYNCGLIHNNLLA